jgi:site-specific DNA-methyltransferase (adenine-specific)
MATLLHGDCLEVMKTLPDKSVDLFLCDLPYGCLTNKSHADGTEGKSKGGKNFTATTGCAWDIPLDLPRFWEQVKRLCKDDHTPVLMFCSTKFGFELYNSNPDWFRYDLVWNKMRGVSFLSANKMPMRSHEMIYVFSKKGATYYRTDMKGDFKKFVRSGKGADRTAVQYGIKQTNEGHREGGDGTRCVLSVVDVGTAKKGTHPTQKPDDLYAWLITRYSKEGDTVLDPTAGSFASVFTAQRLNRKGIGIEQDKAFYDKAVTLSS